MRYLLVLCACLGAGHLVAGEDTEVRVEVYGTKLVVSAPTYNATPEIARRLQAKVTVDWVDTPYEDAVDFLRKTCGVNFVIGPDVRVDAPPVTLKLTDVPLASVLRWMTVITRIRYHMLDGAVYFTNAPIPGKRAVKIYDVADVVHRVPNFVGPTISVGAEGGIMDPFPEADEGESPWSTEELADIIRTSMQVD